MSSAQAEAARRNARLSTGPRTAAGKSASSRNSTRHGILSRHLLPDEDPVEFELLAQRLMEAFSPDGVAEELLVDDLVATVWRLRRLQRVEVALYAVGNPPPVLEALRRSGEADAAVGAAFASQASNFNVLSRYEVTLSNRMRRALNDLQKLQAEREVTDTKLVVIAGER